MSKTGPAAWPSTPGAVSFATFVAREETAMRVRMPLGHRSGVAAVEFALVFSLVMLPTLIGTLEVGRLVQVQQIVSDAAREGARLAAQGQTLDSAGNRVQIMASTGSANVKSTAFDYLYGAGLTQLALTDVTVNFAFTSGAGTDRYQGVKLQPFTVTVSVPFSKLRWINLGFITTNSVGFTTQWKMMIDDPFTVDTTMPTW